MAFNLRINGLFITAILLHIASFGLEKMTSYDELSSFVHQLDRSSDLLKVKVIGQSVVNRQHKVHQ